MPAEELVLPVQGNRSRAEHLQEMFQVFDVDKSGSLSMNEFLSALQLMQGRKVSEAAVACILKEVDSNMDGEINEDEFIVFFDMMEGLKAVEEEIEQGAQKGKVHQAIMIGYFVACFIGFGVFLYIYFSEYEPSEDGSMAAPDPKHASKSFEIGQLGLAVTGSAIALGLIIGVFVPILSYRVTHAQQAMASKMENWRDRGSRSGQRYEMESRRRITQKPKDISFSYRASRQASVPTFPERSATPAVSFDNTANHDPISAEVQAIKDVFAGGAIMDINTDHLSRTLSREGGNPMAGNNKMMSQTWSAGFNRPPGTPMYGDTPKYELSQYESARQMQEQMNKSGGFNPMTNSHAFSGQYRVPTDKYMTWGPEGWKENLIPNSVKSNVEDSDSDSESKSSDESSRGFGQLALQN